MQWSGDDDPERALQAAHPVAQAPGIGYLHPALVDLLRAVKPEDEDKPTLSEGEVLADEIDGTRYEVDQLIGRGGMGEVYRATRLSDGAPCAVKCVRSDLVHNPTILLRTRFEAKAFRRIDHPNVVQVYGIGVRADRVPWMAMKWLEGFTLQQIIEKRGRIPLRWAIVIVRDLCRGAQAIHEHAIHRDIKPSNVHLGLDAVTRVLDLGAAKSKDPSVHLTTTGYQVGTMPFMAPEQLDNTMTVDARADVWAATVVLYILISGVHPFALRGALPASNIKLGYRILQDPHRPLLSVVPKVPHLFSQIIDRGLAKDPEYRHRSAEELAQVLTAALEFLESTTGHAEPLSSLVDQLSNNEPRVVERPRLLWTPPRTTEPMPPPAAASPAPKALVSIVWSAPRTTEPMPAPAPRHVPIHNRPAPAAPAPPAAETTDGLSTSESTDRHRRVTVFPPASTPPRSPATAEDRWVDAEHESVARRQSDVQMKHVPDPARARVALPAAPAVRMGAGNTAQATPAKEAPTALHAAPQLVERREEPRLRQGVGALDWLGAVSLGGAPRWFYIALSAGVMFAAAETLHRFGPPLQVQPPPGPIEVPAVSLPEPADEPGVAPASATPAAGSAEPPASAHEPTTPAAAPASAAPAAGAAEPPASAHEPPAPTAAPASAAPGADFAKPPASADEPPTPAPRVTASPAPRLSPTTRTPKPPLKQSAPAPSPNQAPPQPAPHRMFGSEN